MKFCVKSGKLVMRWMRFSTYALGRELGADGRENTSPRGGGFTHRLRKSNWNSDYKDGKNT